MARSRHNTQQPAQAMPGRPIPAQIAIDGPAASGKTTVGRLLAALYGYQFLDTGLMYRAVTLAALRAGLPARDADGCSRLAASLDISVSAGIDTRIFIATEDVTPRLRDPDVEAAVSAYSAIEGVRTAMVALQRRIARHGPTVLAGRDIGTVVLPDAPLKIYLDASENARAERRARQTQDWAVQRDAELSRADISARDRFDSGRETAPLRCAEDAVYIDTTALTLDEVLVAVVREVECAAR